MANTNTKIAKRVLEDTLHPSTIGMTKGSIRLRWGFFYTHGRTSEYYVNIVNMTLDGIGLNYVIEDHGQIWKNFKGGASTAAQSNFYVIVKIQDVK